MVSGGTEVSATDESRQCREKGGFELSATIGSDAGRDAETSNSCRHQLLCHGRSGDVGNGNGLRPTSEAVDDGEKVSVAV